MPRSTASRAWLALVVALGVLWHLPGLQAGLYLDDYLHQLVLRGEDVPMSRWSLYDFRSRSEWEGLEDQGVGGQPFWISDDWSVRFARPLTSAALVAEHALFGEWESGYVLVGLAWFALTLLVVFRLFEALGLTRGESLLAVAFFGASGSTVIPVEWTANRNSLLEVLFLAAAALAAARGRPWLGFGAALLAVLSKESGILGFVLVPLILARHDPERARRAAPVGAALAVAYLGALVGLGYGTDSAFYVTPWEEPLHYAGRALLLVLVGVPSLVGPYPIDLVPLGRELAIALGGAGLVLGPIAITLVTRLGRGGSARGLLAFWVFASLLMQGAAPASDRLLVVAAVPAAALVAQAVARGWSSARRAPRLGAAALCASAGPAAAVLTVVTGTQMADFSKEVRTSVLTADVGEPELGRREVFVMQVRNSMVAFGLGTTWGVKSSDLDLRFHVVQVGRRGLRWSRTDERTFVVESLDEPFLSRPFEIVYSTRDDLVLEEGRRWRGPCFEVELTRMDEEGARELTFHLDAAPGPETRFLFPGGADGTELLHRDLPAVGETVEIASPDVPHPFYP